MGKLIFIIHAIKPAMKFIFLLLLSYMSVPLNAQMITTVAGNRTLAYSGDGGLATSPKCTGTLVLL